MLVGISSVQTPATRLASSSCFVPKYSTICKSTPRNFRGPWRIRMAKLAIRSAGAAAPTRMQSGAVIPAPGADAGQGNRKLQPASSEFIRRKQRINRKNREPDAMKQRFPADPLHPRAPKPSRATGGAGPQRQESRSTFLCRRALLLRADISEAVVGWSKGRIIDCAHAPAPAGRARRRSSPAGLRRNEAPDRIQTRKRYTRLGRR
jgi:hypothetical protein